MRQEIETKVVWKSAIEIYLKFVVQDLLMNWLSLLIDIDKQKVSRCPIENQLTISKTPLI